MLIYLEFLKRYVEKDNLGKLRGNAYCPFDSDSDSGFCYSTIYSLRLFNGAKFLFPRLFDN